MCTEMSEQGNSTHAAFRHLRDLIVRGRLAPGTWMVEADVAERLQLSRTPVRSALHQLAGEGYIHAAGAGRKARLMVAPLTREDACELYLIIGRLEGLGARQAAALPRPRRTALAAALRGINRQLGALAGKPTADAGRIFELDLAFHRTLLEAAAGPRLREMHARIQPQAERYWRLYAGAITGSLRLSVTEHHAIIAAVQQGDAGAAEHGVQRNWSLGFQRLSRIIDSLGPRGGW